MPTEHTHSSDRSSYECVGPTLFGESGICPEKQQFQVKNLQQQRLQVVTASPICTQ